MIRARDIMRTEVVTVGPHTSARELARLLSDEGIGGAPVVDSRGELLGVVSRTDLVRMFADEAERPARVGASSGSWLGGSEDIDEDGFDPRTFFLADAYFPDGEALARVAGSGLDREEVSDLMTPATFSVDPDAPLPEVAHFLVHGRIHRALVVDDRRLVGIVTATDVLRAVAQHGLGG